MELNKTPLMLFDTTVRTRRPLAVYAPLRKHVIRIPSSYPFSDDNEDDDDDDDDDDGNTNAKGCQNEGMRVVQIRDGEMSRAPRAQDIR
ncbi:hypothetical protein PV325_013026 [Microctonus aethiopoides]|nr:hypothetical protein PV325_013026 [Microctonus aethiopoides]